MELEKEIQFKKEGNEKKKMLSMIFHALFPFINKFKEHVENEHKNDLHSSKIDNFLEAQLLLLVQQSVEGGYKLNKTQEEEFDKQFFEKVRYNVFVKNQEVDDIFSHGYKIKEDFLINFIFSIEKLDSVQRSLLKNKVNAEAAENENKIITLMRKEKNNPIIIKKILDLGIKKLNEHINKSSGLYDTRGAVKIYNVLLDNIDHFSIDECLTLLNLAKKIKEINSDFEYMLVRYGIGKNEMEGINDAIKLLKSHLETGFKNEKKEFIQSIKQTTITGIVKEQIINNLESSKKFDLTELPLKANDLIKKIEKNILKCIDNKELLNIEDVRVLDLIKEKRLSETLTKYLKIDPEYRSEMKNSKNQTAEDLMIEALEDFYEITNKYVTNINMSSLRDLSVNNNYIKELKKSV